MCFLLRGIWSPSPWCDLYHPIHPPPHFSERLFIKGLTLVIYVISGTCVFSVYILHHPPPTTANGEHHTHLSTLTHSHIHLSTATKTAPQQTTSTFSVVFTPCNDSWETVQWGFILSVLCTKDSWLRIIFNRPLKVKGWRQICTLDPELYQPSWPIQTLQCKVVLWDYIKTSVILVPFVYLAYSCFELPFIWIFSIFCLLTFFCFHWFLFYLTLIWVYFNFSLSHFGTSP